MVELIGVPFDGYGRDGHQAGAARTLRESGLSTALGPHQVVDGEDLMRPSDTSARGSRRR
ncbi:hypothetical protein [Amycolatopsis suaedae]|uniref:hypothetical protein n=1 Tax=Amycolatopsis suaedae TaxID=2510978 RepID=UPI00196ABE63|nr:hypothetical protein [Amycolatopsis suaedae]